VPVEIVVNGAPRQVFVEPRRTLLDALRWDLGLTGAKRVCDEGDCGACTVILDGKPVYACLVLAVDAEGRSVETVEGLAGPDGAPHPVQRAFVADEALQCGFCTPGQVVSVCALLRENPSPTEDDVRRAIAGNLCRCGTYPRIVAAARDAAAEIRGDRRTG